MKHFRVVHRLSRRIRVIAPPLVKEAERCYILEILLRKHPAVKDVAVVAGIGSSTRWYRTIFLEEIGKDYVRTARARDSRKSRSFSATCCATR